MMQPTNKYVFSIAGIVIQLDTEQSLEIEDAFMDFQTESQEPEIYAVFHEVDKLPELSENILQKTQYYQIHTDENGEEVCSFIDEARSLEPYAVRMVENRGSLIKIDYLKRGRRCVSELRNSFAHLDFEAIMLRKSRLCFHAACVDTAFGGILFTGESGIGKSTQAELWRLYRNAVPINGDRPVLAYEAGEWYAWGSPYAGSSNYHVNKNCTIRLIVLIKQGAVCSVRKLNLLESFKVIWQGITVHSWDKAYIEKASELAMSLAQKVPVLELTCTPDERAVECLELEIRKEWKGYE